MSTYQEVPISLQEKVMEVMKERHKDLATVGVKLDVLFAYAAKNEAGEKTGPALKRSGHQVNGLSSITSLKNRVKGLQDGEILLDGDYWDKLSDSVKVAIIDHLLQFFEVSRNVLGEAIYDDIGRPKLKLRLHDVSLGWFTDVATRNGDASIEITQARALFGAAKDSFFPFLEEVAKESRPLKVLPKSNVKEIEVNVLDEEAKAAAESGDAAPTPEPDKIIPARKPRAKKK